MNVRSSLLLLCCPPQALIVTCIWVKLSSKSLINLSFSAVYDSTISQLRHEMYIFMSTLDCLFVMNLIGDWSIHLCYQEPESFWKVITWLRIIFFYWRFHNYSSFCSGVAWVKNNNGAPASEGCVCVCVWRMGGGVSDSMDEMRIDKAIDRGQDVGYGHNVLLSRSLSRLSLLVLFLSISLLVSRLKARHPCPP